MSMRGALFRRRVPPLPKPPTMASLADISRISAQKDKAPAYVSLLSSELAKAPSPPIRDIETIVNAVLGETPVVARQVLTELAKLLRDRASVLGGELLQDLLRSVLSIIGPRGVTFDEQVSCGTS